MDPLFEEFERVSATLEKLTSRQDELLRLMRERKIAEEKGKTSQEETAQEETVEETAQDEKIPSDIRDEFIEERKHRLQDFCKDCDSIMLNSSYDHNYVCWVCGTDGGGRWGWDSDYGIVVCGGGAHVPKSESPEKYLSLKVDTEEDRTEEDRTEKTEETEYISCATIANKIYPEINLGDYSPKAVYPCMCTQGMGNMCRAFHPVKEKRV